jgi:hypothetical protein
LLQKLQRTISALSDEETDRTRSSTMFGVDSSLGVGLWSWLGKKWAAEVVFDAPEAQFELEDLEQTACDEDPGWKEVASSS